MKSRTWLSVALLAISALQDFSWGGPSDRIPFHLVEGHILVTASLTGGDILTFAVDTGTTYTMIDSRVARDYGLKKGKAVTVDVIGKRVNVYETQIPRICFGSTCFESVSARICDLSRFSHLDGLLGLEVFRRGGLTLNFTENYLEFHATDGLASSQKFVGVLPFVPIRVQCQDQTLVLMLDSAGIDLILFEERIKNLVTLERTGASRRVQGAGASARVEAVLTPDLSVGHLELKNRTAYLWTKPNSKRIHGIVGVAGLGLKQLSLDFEDHRVSWE